MSKHFVSLRDAAKLWTVRWAAAVALLPEALFRFAVAVGDTLPALQPVVVEYLPANVRAALAIAGIVSMFLRLWKQNNVGPDLH